jgi:hypothetical protein
MTDQRSSSGTADALENIIKAANGHDNNSALCWTRIDEIRKLATAELAALRGVAQTQPDRHTLVERAVRAYCRRNAGAEVGTLSINDLVCEIEAALEGTNGPAYQPLDREQVAALLYVARWPHRTWITARLDETAHAYRQADAVLSLVSSTDRGSPPLVNASDAAEAADQLAGDPERDRGR